MRVYPSTTSKSADHNPGIQYPELAFGAQYGFASIGTNNGHNGTSGGAFFHQPDVLEDFAGRAILAGTQVGKSITKQFYGADLGRSYYLGCSTGGRQGFRAVQKYPELFDGVVAGAPVLKQWGHAAYFGYVKQVLGLNSSSITPAQWSAVQSEVFRQCDDLDGAKDGILENPDSCTLDWTPLLCKYNDTAVCFTDSQAVTAAKLFEPMIYNGTFLGPSQNHGFEPLMIASLYSPLVSSWVPEIMRYMVYEDLSWDPATFTLQDILKGIEKDNFDLSTFEGNISAFRDRGGKVLHWHGGADQLITMRTSNLYYETVRSALNASVAELDQFYRYFRASGVNHCSGGPGASFMGQIGGTVGGVDPADNLLLSIVQWVELGIAPEYIRGTKFINDTRSLGVQYRRKHCKYPKTNKYTANGDGFDEEGWQCVEP